MPKRSSNAERTAVRSVYEVQVNQRRQQIEAATTAELAQQLGRLVPHLDPYAARAAARLVAVERATVATPDWTLKRVGSFVFQPDPAPAPRVARKAVAPPADQPETAPTNLLEQLGLQGEFDQSAVVPPEQRPAD